MLFKRHKLVFFCASSITYNLQLRDESIFEKGVNKYHIYKYTYNAVLYNADSIITSPRGSQVFFQYTVCESVSRRSRLYTMQAVKIVLPVYFLAKFDTS